MAHVTTEYWECDRCGKRVDSPDDMRDWLEEHYTGFLLCMPCGGRLKALAFDFIHHRQPSLAPSKDGKP